MFDRAHTPQTKTLIWHIMKNWKVILSDPDITQLIAGDSCFIFTSKINFFFFFFFFFHINYSLSFTCWQQNADPESAILCYLLVFEIKRVSPFKQPAELQALWMEITSSFPNAWSLICISVRTSLRWMNEKLSCTRNRPGQCLDGSLRRWTRWRWRWFCPMPRRASAVCLPAAEAAPTAPEDAGTCERAAPTASFISGSRTATLD